ncbi:hypothetical protein Aph01nite_05040 [Acrocarpospora phusangensis]|uniref:Uncharacterized protein n=1 Tax=Acrocarpospora phusangensis TaxID=1070424 RepID=A0A919Q6M4_9ACTN|nr:hypothetical protein Aph01nite_05040 [Acrocarpospora phusangensis]
MDGPQHLAALVGLLERVRERRLAAGALVHPDHDAHGFSVNRIDHYLSPIYLPFDSVNAIPTQGHKSLSGGSLGHTPQAAYLKRHATPSYAAPGSRRSGRRGSSFRLPGRLASWRFAGPVPEPLRPGFLLAELPEPSLDIDMMTRLP